MRPALGNRMKSAQYDVVVQEHDSTPWSDGHAFTRAGAWARIRGLAALVVPDWPHPVWVRVWRLYSKRTADGKLCKCKVCVYTGDLRYIKSTT
jgi:hypothetical protein